MQGIVILAIGHGNYARLAVNLAITLKATGDNIPVALLYSNAHDNYKCTLDYIPNHLKTLFTHLIEVPEEYYTYKGRFIYQKAKNYLYNLSPFDGSLCIDADSLWVHDFRGMNNDSKHSPEALLNELLNINLTYTLYSSQPNNVSWLTKELTLEMIRKEYGIPDENIFYNIQSSVIYFSKGLKAERYFEISQKLYNTFSMPCVQWAGALPDEMIFNLASAMMGIVPHNIDWKLLAQPVSVKLNNSNIEKIFAEYSLLSMSGAQVPGGYIRAYQYLIGKAHQKLKGQLGNIMPYHYVQKKDFLPRARRTM